MAPSLTADFTTMAKWSLKAGRRTDDYTERLGLPQTEASKHSRGPPKFEGDLATDCTALYDLTTKAVNKIFGDCFTVQDLESAVYQQDALSIGNIVEPVLTLYGPDIWCSFEPYATQIRWPKYPRHLQYYNHGDRERIELYLYCWIISRARAKIHQQEERRSQRGGQRPPINDLSDGDYVDNADLDNADSVMGEDVAASELNENSEPFTGNMTSDQGRAHASPILNPAVPTAQMLPLGNNAITNIAQADIARSENVQASASRLTFTMASADDEFASGSGNEGPSILQARPGRLSQIKRRYTSGQPTPLTKKQKMARAQKSVTDLKAPALSTRARTRGEVDDAEDLDATSYPSPPLVRHDTLLDGEVTRNFPNISHTIRDVEQTKDIRRGGLSERSVSAPDQDVRSNSGRSADDAIVVDARDSPAPGDTEDDDANRMQGTDIDSDAHLQPRASKKSPAPAAPRRLVVPIKVTAPSEDDEFFRQRLASKLLDVLLEKLQQPNALLLSGTLSLLESRFKIEHLRLQKVYCKKFNNHKESFTRWIECLRDVMQFYTSTEFNGNLSTRPTFLKAVPFKRKIDLMKPFVHGRVSLTAWRKERGISIEDVSNEVGSLLFHLASWDDWADVHDVEQMTLGFTEELLAWFK